MPGGKALLASIWDSGCSLEAYLELFNSIVALYLDLIVPKAAVVAVLDHG
jgi:hypothetical protein